MKAPGSPAGAKRQTDPCLAMAERESLSYPNVVRLSPYDFRTLNTEAPMRRAAAVDGNQRQIVQALRAVGATVQHLHQVGAGCPDLMVGYRRRTFLLEVKDPAQQPSRQRLTPDEETWHRVWKGLPVETVRTVAEALRAIGAQGGQS